jgi:hypothetical protein
MATIYKIQLVSKNVKSGKFVKNRSHYYPALKGLIIGENKRFFNHWLYGKIRVAVLDLVFATLSKLTDHG